ncbi:hypothetical protein IV500_06080 [Paeniglutamicibacter antarcticus]|uniref:Uncharacterized protein n=1 Tax=Arthrobacter terrae TaxID=2935737 RepID=A0A931CQ68_9MICC|nr:hypothetical protein [Arthrobacter terrae]MBG0738991.1 hypothetical protein [Arthrobacter terrae]
MTEASSRPARKACIPYPTGKATPLAMTVNDLSVLVIARRLHDEKCYEREDCNRRDNHSLEGFEAPVRKTLGVLVDAHTAREI